MDELLSIRENTTSNLDLGGEGERLAANFLQQNGYRIVLTNFTVPVGRNTKGVQVTGEIDIVALDAETLCFIEVKTRRSADFNRCWAMRRWRGACRHAIAIPSSSTWRSRRAQPAR